MKHPLLISLTALALLAPTSLHAVPARPVQRTVTLADGRSHTLTLTGDEHCHYWLSDEGRPMRLASSGKWRELTTFELENMQAKAAESRESSNARRARRRAIGNFQPLTGKKRGIVILMRFQDQDFSIENPREVYNDFFNKKGYTDYGMTGSVADYFRAQSYGQFELEFDIVGPFTLRQNMAFYGAPNGDNHDTNPRGMVEEAVRAAAKQVDFTPYDWNDDGEVNQVFIIYAGYGEAQGADENTIWPHESRLGEALTFNGKTINTYACSCELAGKSGATIDGIGTACHEFSHCLGLPDFYDVKYNGGFGMATWDLMDQGSYNGDSRTPAGYTSYERWMAGWLTPTEITKETDISNMRPLAETPEAYILYNDANRDEYYLLENRQFTGFDSALYGHGLLVLHVDYDQAAWRSNSVNTQKSHQHMSIITADGDNTMGTLSGDPFPGKAGTTQLTDESQPTATLFNDNSDGQRLMHKSIERIQESSEGFISFTAMRPLLGKPTVKITSATESNVTIQWEAVPMATSYEVQITETPVKQSADEARTLEEHFTKTYKKTAGFSDIGSKLNDYLDTPGFSGTKLYQSPGYLRFGTGTENGNLRSPVQKALTTGQLTIVMTVAPFAEGTEVAGKVRVVTNGKGVEEVPFAFSTAQTILIYPEMQLDEIFRIDIEPTSRMYISYLAFYDGMFTAEELGIGAKVKAAAPRRVKTSTTTTLATTYTLTQPTPSSTYSFTVRALEDMRTSRWSDAVTAGPWGSGIDALRYGTQNGSHTTTATDRMLYDLSGRRIEKPTKSGLYIQGGKKYLTK